jgi:hypothetical protein
MHTAKVSCVQTLLVALWTAALSISFCATAMAAPTERGFQMPLGSLTATNLDELKNNWKVNVVRVQIGDDFRMDGLEGTQYDALMENLYQILDARLPLLAERGIKLIFCLYSPPGGFATREAPSHYAIFSRADLQAHFVQTWQTIAARYGANPTVAAFDLANEPAMRPSLLGAGLKDWNGVVIDTVAAIRAVAPTKTIIVKSLYGDPTKLKRLPIFNDPNVHYGYNPYIYHKYQDSGINVPAFSVPRPADDAILGKVRRLLAPFFITVHKAVEAKKVAAGIYPPKVVVAEAAVSACAVEPGSFFNGLLGALESDESARGSDLRAKALKKWKRMRRKNRRLRKPVFTASDFLLDVQHSGYTIHAYDEFTAWDPRYTCNASGEVVLSPTETEQAVVLKGFFSRN